jgi:hypothetical protein
MFCFTVYKAYFSEISNNIQAALFDYTYMWLQRSVRVQVRQVHTYTWLQHSVRVQVRQVHTYTWLQRSVRVQVRHVHT